MSSDLRENEVREFLERMATEMPTPMQVPPRAIGRARRKLARTFLAGSLAAGLAVVGVLSGTRAILRSEPQPANEIDRETVVPIALDHAASRVAIGEGSVWVGGVGTPDSVGGVTRVDPATNQVVATFPGDAVYGCAIAVGEGAAWVSGPGTQLVRIDPVSNEASTILADTGGWTGPCAIAFHGLAVAGGSVWGFQDLSPLSRIDPGTGQVTTINRGENAGAVGVLDGTVWVATWRSKGDDEVDGYPFGVDASTSEVVATIPIRVHGVTAGFGSLWSETSDEDSVDIVRIDPATRSVVARLDLVAALDLTYDRDAPPQVSVAIGQGAVWVTVSVDYRGATAYRVVRIDPATNEIAGVIDLETPATDIAVGAGSVWVTDGEGTLYKIDPDAVVGS